MRTPRWTYKALLLFIAILLWNVSLFAQLQIALNRDSIGFGETAVVTLSGEVKDISSFAELPSSEGYIVTGRTSNYSFNGKSGKIKLQQTFILQPLKSGTFEVGPAWVQSGSKRTFSNRLELTITGGTSAAPNNTIFLRCEPNKKKVVVGEEVILTLRIYRRMDDEIYSTDRPLAKAFNGFYYVSGPYPIDTEYPDTIISVNGIKYIGKVIYREFIFPNKAGKLPLPTYSFTCTVKQNLYPTGDDLIDNLNAIETQVELETKPLSIEAVETPSASKPADYHGDVGKFSMSAFIDHSSVNANNPVKLTVTISGSGNISLLQIQKMILPDSFDVFPSIGTDSLLITSDGVNGSKKFELNFIPRLKGDYKLPPINFTYYDPQQKKYETLTTAGFDLHVNAAVADDSQIKSNLPDGFFSGPTSSALKLKIILFSVLLLAALTFLFLYRKKKRKTKSESATVTIEENTEELPIRSEPSPWIGFQSAGQFYSMGNITRCFTEQYNTLRMACGQKCELGDEEASPSHIRYRLQTKKVMEQDIIFILDTLNELSALRYDRSSMLPPKAAEMLEKTRLSLQKLGF